MFGGINPSQMKALMKQMGMKQEEISVNRVIFECNDKNIIVEPANVQKITMQGQDSFQITGEIREENREESIKPEDINLVIEKTGVSKEEALKALEENNGDIAQAIISLG